MIDSFNTNQIDSGPKKGMVKIEVICDEVTSQVILKIFSQIFGMTTGLSMLARAVMETIPSKGGK